VIFQTYLNINEYQNWFFQTRLKVIESQGWFSKHIRSLSNIKDGFPNTPIGYRMSMMVFQTRPKNKKAVILGND
jgi:hypothetical protein